MSSSARLDTGPWIQGPRHKGQGPGSRALALDPRPRIQGFCQQLTYKSISINKSMYGKCTRINVRSQPRDLRHQHSRDSLSDYVGAPCSSVPVIAASLRRTHSRTAAFLSAADKAWGSGLHFAAMAATLALDPRPWIRSPGSRAHDPWPWIWGLETRALTST